MESVLTALHIPRKPVVGPRNLLLLPILLLLAVCCCPCHAQGSAARGPPNIVFIMADDLGYNDIGYHNQDIWSPNIDYLSAQGVRLENYYVQPVCTPTRSQFLSGRHQIHTGMQHKNIRPLQRHALPLGSPTLPDKLKEAGYSTHAVGKWHLGFYHRRYLPTRRGFDTFYGMYLGSAGHFSHRRCTNRWCGLDFHNDTTTDFPVSHLTFRMNQRYSTSLYTRRAVDLIRAHPSDGNPLFLYLAYQAPHAPLEVPRRYIALNPRFRRPYRRVFASMVTALDEAVGQVVTALQESGLWQNTILVFSSDNGAAVHLGGSNQPLRGAKGKLFEGGVRAVGFVASPLLEQTGYSNDQLMHVSDWFPTFVHLANGSLSGTRDVLGTDQWDVISRRALTNRTELLHNIDPLSRTGATPLFPWTFDTTVMAALRQGDYKLITGLNTPEHLKLFNVRRDPSEREDLASQQPQRVQAMLARLQEFQDTAVPARFPPDDVTSNPIRMGRWAPWT